MLRRPFNYHGQRHESLSILCLPIIPGYGIQRRRSQFVSWLLLLVIVVIAVFSFMKSRLVGGGSGLWPPCLYLRLAIFRVHAEVLRGVQERRVRRGW